MVRCGRNRESLRLPLLLKLEHLGEFAYFLLHRLDAGKLVKFLQYVLDLLAGLSVKGGLGGQVFGQNGLEILFSRILHLPDTPGLLFKRLLEVGAHEPCVGERVHPLRKFVFHPIVNDLEDVT